MHLMFYLVYRSRAVWLTGTVSFDWQAYPFRLIDRCRICRQSTDQHLLLFDWQVCVVWLTGLRIVRFDRSPHRLIWQVPAPFDWQVVASFDWQVSASFDWQVSASFDLTGRGIVWLTGLRVVWLTGPCIVWFDRSPHRLIWQVSASFDLTGRGIVWLTGLCIVWLTGLCVVWFDRSWRRLIDRSPHRLIDRSPHRLIWQVVASFDLTGPRVVWLTGPRVIWLTGRGIVWLTGLRFVWLTGAESAGRAQTNIFWRSVTSVNSSTISDVCSLRYPECQRRRSWWDGTFLCSKIINNNRGNDSF